MNILDTIDFLNRQLSAYNIGDLTIDTSKEANATILIARATVRARLRKLSERIDTILELN